jgi:hypothetical protein
MIEPFFPFKDSVGAELDTECAVKAIVTERDPVFTD